MIISVYTWYIYTIWTVQYLYNIWIYIYNMTNVCFNPPESLKTSTVTLSSSDAQETQNTSGGSRRASRIWEALRFTCFFVRIFPGEFCFLGFFGCSNKIQKGWVPNIVLDVFGWFLLDPHVWQHTLLMIWQFDPKSKMKLRCGKQQVK